MGDSTEDAIQRQVLQWSKHKRYGGEALFDHIVHVPNGGHRHIATAKRMKAQGVKAGYPDLLIDIPAGGYHGLRIELKRDKGGRLSDLQKTWLDRLTEQGYRAVVCAGFDATINEIKTYLDIK